MKKNMLILIIMPCLGAASLHAQKENVAIRKGNRYYKEKNLDESQKQYQEALQESPDNPAANYNMGNAQFRKNNFEGASKSYDEAIAHTDNKAYKEQSYYNKGLSTVKQQKLEESIAAWKDALKLNPEDREARENLQKALMELKNKQQQQQQKDKPSQEKKKDKKDQKEQDQPQPQKSRLSKQKVEQYLKALEQQEKDVQDKMNQNKAKTLNQPDKDW